MTNGEVDECIVPLENSIRGTVLETLDSLLEDEKLSIVHEIVLDIKHCLMANKKYNNEDIKTIYSHTQALGQCKKYIQNNIPNCIIHEVESTAKGAQLAKENDYSACIANKDCASIYELELMDTNIQDRNNNQTRFIVLSKENENKEENSKITIIFSTSNNPGALYKILGLFNIFDVNLTKIESRPAQTGLGEYWFWVDFEGNIKEENVKSLLDIVKKQCSFFRILGMYY